MTFLTKDAIIVVANASFWIYGEWNIATKRPDKFVYKNNQILR